VTRDERVAVVRDALGGNVEPYGSAPGHGTHCWCGGRRYTCPGCRRFVLECDGAADDAPELCDDCWGVLHRTTEQSTESH